MSSFASAAFSNPEVLLLLNINLLQTHGSEEAQASALFSVLGRYVLPLGLYYLSHSSASLPVRTSPEPLRGVVFSLSLVDSSLSAIIDVLPFLLRVRSMGCICAAVITFPNECINVLVSLTPVNTR